MTQATKATKMGPKRTYRVLYDALAHLTDYEQVALGRAHAANAVDFLSRWPISVNQAEQRPVDAEEHFHDRTDEVLPEPGPVDAVVSTREFACHLAHGTYWDVSAAPELAFRYVDREIFLARTRNRDAQIAPRSLDLLLVGLDGMPIIGELKRERDRLPYYALVQLFTHAVELAIPEQRQRLQRHYGPSGLTIPREGPFADLYLIGYRTPSNWTHFDASLKATETLAERCVADPRIGTYIRRIAYIEGAPAGDRLRFHRRFMHGT